MRVAWLNFPNFTLATLCQYRCINQNNGEFLIWKLYSLFIVGAWEHGEWGGYLDAIRLSWVDRFYQLKLEISVPLRPAYQISKGITVIYAAWAVLVLMHTTVLRTVSWPLTWHDLQKIWSFSSISSSRKCHSAIYRQQCPYSNHHSSPNFPIIRSHFILIFHQT